MSAPNPPAWIRGLARRLLPGAYGTDAVAELDEEFRARAQGGALAELRAALWYLGQVVRPDTVRLAVRLRRRARRPVTADHPVSARSARDRVADLGRDLRHLLRGLRRDPAFAGVAIVVLSLGIGASTAMFSVIDGLLLRGPRHVVAPQELVRLYLTRQTPSAEVVTSAWQPYVLYANVRDEASAFSTVTAYVSDSLRVGTGIEARFVPVAYATPDLFPLTGVRPLLGRFYGPDEDHPPNGADVVVLGYGFWQREFAGDSAIIGGSVTLGDRRFQAIGVAPPQFTGVERTRVDAWLPMSDRPLSARTADDWDTSWRSPPLSIVGRLATSNEAAEAELTALVRRAYTGPDESMQEASASLRPISYDMGGQEPTAFGVARLSAALAVVMLLIAGANTTNLLLARALRRHRELSVRVALGAGRWRVVGLVVGESLAISVLGGLLGLAVAYWGSAIIRRTLLPDMTWTDVALNARVLTWTVVATLLAGLLVALIPALRVSRGHAVGALRVGRAGGGDSNARTRTALQILQFGLSITLLYTAGLFVRSLYDVRNLDLGYDRDTVLAVDVAYPPADETAGAGGAITARARYDGLRSRLERVPGVTHVSTAVGSPLSALNVLRMQVPGRDSLPPSAGITVITAASPDYFETVGTRLLRGRGFTASDMSGTTPTIVVNETLANTIWPSGDPIGQCLVLAGSSDGACARVVGVAQDVHHMLLSEPPINQSYVPWGQQLNTQGTVLLVRTSGAAQAVVPSLLASLQPMAEDFQSVRINSFEELLEPQARPWRAGATLLGLFGLIVVVVAAAGVFGVVSYSVTQRRPELGVRMALGAQRGRVLRLMMHRGVRTALVGVVLGGVVLFATARSVQPLLFDNPAWDPPMLAAVALLLIAVSAAASLWPSWRATRVDPLLSLRAE